MPLDCRGRIRSFCIGADVYARNYVSNPLWLPGKIIGITGTYSYEVELEDGRLWRHHIDQLHGQESPTREQSVIQGPPRDLKELTPATGDKDTTRDESMSNQDQNGDLQLEARLFPEVWLQPRVQRRPGTTREWREPFLVLQPSKLY